ncbi:MAG: ankyrin repeat domain-containing protein [Campylobacteraceae bacterium]
MKLLSTIATFVFVIFLFALAIFMFWFFLNNKTKSNIKQAFKNPAKGIFFIILSIFIIIIGYFVKEEIYKLTHKIDFSKENSTFEFTARSYDIGKTFGLRYIFPKKESFSTYSNCLNLNAKYIVEYFKDDKLFYTQIVDKLRSTESLYSWCNDKMCYMPFATIKDFQEINTPYKVKVTTIEPSYLLQGFGDKITTYYDIRGSAPFLKGKNKISASQIDKPITNEKREDNIKQVLKSCERASVIFSKEQNQTLADLKEYIKQDDTKKVKELIVNGISVNVKMNYDNTPLMLASYYNSLNVMKYLLENKADVEAKNSLDSRAILFAFGKKNTEAIKLLLEHNATLKEDDKIYPYVVGDSGMVFFSRKHSLSYFITSALYYDGLKLYLEYGLDVNYFDFFISGYDDTNATKKYAFTLLDAIKNNTEKHSEEGKKIINLVEQYNGKTYRELVNENKTKN